jgi:hypothetical protein
MCTARIFNLYLHRVEELYILKFPKRYTIKKTGYVLKILILEKEILTDEW